MSPEPTAELAAQAARSAYYRDVPDIPAWEDLHPSIRADWRAVAAALRPTPAADPPATSEADAITWEDATPVDVLYLLRNEADRQMKRLQAQAEAMRVELAKAEAMISRLDGLADDAQAAAELVHDALAARSAALRTTTSEDPTDAA